MSAPSGDAPPPAFEEVVERYQTRIYGFLSRMCRSREDAKDALQDTLLSAFRAFGDFRGEAAVTTWLFRIAANACLKFRRKGKFEPAHELSLDEFIPSAPPAGRPQVADWSASPERALLDGELQRALEAGIADLPPAYRVVLVLRDIEGLTAEEVGEVIGLSVPAVKSRLHRARLFLRQRLADQVEGRG